MATFLRTVFRYAKKACAEKIYRTEVVFVRKIYDFPYKNNFGPKNPFQRRFLSEAKKSQ